MTALPATRRHPRRLAARRPADRGPDPVVGQARTARGHRRHRGARDGGDGLRLAVEGARAGRRRRTRRRTARLPRHRVLRAGGQPQRRQARDRRGTALDRVRGVGRRRAQPRQRGPHHARKRPRRSPRSSRSPTTAASPSRSSSPPRGTARSTDRPPPQRVLDIVDRGHRRRRRPAGHRRHHRHHHPAAGQRPGRPRPAADRRHPAGRALPQHPRRRVWPVPTPRSAPASPGWTPRSAGSAAARSRRAPAATSPPRIWCTCCGTAEIHVDVDLQAAIAAARVAQDVVGHDLPERAAARRRPDPGLSGRGRRTTGNAERQGPPDPARHRAGRPEAVRRARLSRHHPGRHHLGGGQVTRGVLPLLRRQGGSAGRAGRVVPARRRHTVGAEPAPARVAGRRRVLHRGGHRLLERCSSRTSAS